MSNVTRKRCAGPSCDQLAKSAHHLAKFCSRTCERRAKRQRDGDVIRAQEMESKRRNAERVRESKRQWYLQNADLVKKRANLWYHSNTERAAAATRARYERNGEAARARAAAYRKANPAKVAQWRANYRSLVEASGELIDPVEVFERDGWMCGICDQAIDPSLSHPDRRMASLDHVVPLSKGGAHTWSNVQASHLACNNRKRARLPAA